jgi:hypothetical protein
VDAAAALVAALAAATPAPDFHAQILGEMRLVDRAEKGVRVTTFVYVNATTAPAAHRPEESFGYFKIDFRQLREIHGGFKVSDSELTLNCSEEQARALAAAIEAAFAPHPSDIAVAFASAAS